MKPIKKLSLALLLVLALGLLAGCSPYLSSGQNGLVVASTYRLRSGEILNHDLTIMAATAELDEGSTVNGNVAVIGGSLSVKGRVNGDISAVGGAVSLSDTAVVEGNVHSVAASISQADKATIRGDLGFAPPTFVPINPIRPAVEVGVNFVGDVLGRIFQALALAAMAVLVSLFALRPMERVGDAMTAQPFTAGGIGLLSIVVLPVMMVIISITIILLPVGLVGMLALGIAVLLGWISAGLLTGERLARALQQNWSGPLSAGVGSLVISLAVSLISVIPCIGWMAGFLVTVVGLGGVILTRFGLQRYPPSQGVPYMTSALTPDMAPDQPDEPAI